MSALVIVGSGLAGYTLARELRKLDRRSTVTVITADGGEMYAKPMLSNAFLQNKSLPSLVGKSARDLGAELDIAIRTRTRVRSLDRDRRVVVTNEGDVAYDRLVLAVGADPRPYAVPGSDVTPIATVNDLDGYRAWREALGAGNRVLLIGAGLIGCEFANDLLSAGFKVVVVDPAPWPLGRLLPEALGQEMKRRLEKAGLTILCGRSVTRVTSAATGGAVATLDDGTDIPFDNALSAIGLVPRTNLAREAGLKVNRGIVVDRLLATSDPAIFALGDCAETEAGPLPFVLPLMAEAKALAVTLAGTPTPLVLPALPVVVKTPAFPLVVCPPPAGREGEWRITGEAPDLKAMYVGEDGTPLGFVLTGGQVGGRQALAGDMPFVIAPAGAVPA